MSAANAQPLQGFLRQMMPKGEVLRDFLTHPAPVSCIMGPYGSGKTTGCFLKGLLCSAAVPPSPIDGVRYSRGAVVRDTYRNLETNTIPSWEECFPRDVFKMKGGSGGEPARANLEFVIDDGTTMRMEVLFVAVGDHNVKEFCDGLQVTWAMLNGMDALPREMLSYMRPRLGRYPAPQHRPADWKKYVPYWRKLYGDMNAPDLDNFTYEDFVETPLKGYKLFEQPGGLDPKAENVENLPSDYYDTLMDGKEEWWLNRFVHNKFGYSRSGKPVYLDYSEPLHGMSFDIPLNPSRELIVGMDGGRDACAIAMQRRANGGLDILAELIPEERMGAKQFGKWLSHMLNALFPGARNIVGYADPATADPNDTDDDAMWIEIVARVADIPIDPAPSNLLTPRMESVRELLRQQDEGVPLLRVSRRCKVIRRGFSSGYIFSEQKSLQESRGSTIKTFQPVPLKNSYSHPMNALEYGALGSSDWAALQGRNKTRRRTREETSWDPHAHG